MQMWSSGWYRSLGMPLGDLIQAPLREMISKLHLGHPPTQVGDLSSPPADTDGGREPPIVQGGHSSAHSDTSRRTQDDASAIIGRIQSHNGVGGAVPE